MIAYTALFTGLHRQEFVGEELPVSITGWGVFIVEDMPVKEYSKNAE
jgi:hypothetical protein